jgi:glycosyltransferase involved in cell wall biosynthesis
MGKLETQKVKKPLVSVLTTVYNAEEYLNMAIDSILLQTYKNYEYILIDDGSTDHSRQIIEAYDDPRIKYIYQKNQGLQAALNRGISIAKGKYIARMDHDDISYPSRLEKQVSFLESNKKIAMVGTSFDIIDSDSGIVGGSYHLDRDEDIRIEFLVRNPFGHGTMMICKEALEDVGGYDVTESVEDYDLWWRIAKKYKVANIPEMLYGWRVVPTGISIGSSAQRQQPITKFMASIWRESSVPKLSTHEFITALNHYRDLGAPYREQYLYMVYALTASEYSLGFPVAALSNLRRLIRVRGTMSAFNNFRKNPYTHNYNLGIIHRIGRLK